MTLKEAIETNKVLGKDLRISNAPIVADAVNLGIEALKRLEEARFDQRTPYTRPLPGETKE